MADLFVSVRSNFSPTVTFDPTKVDTSPLRGGILKLLQPSIDVNIPIVGNKHYAPYGEPTGWGVLVFAIVIALALYGTYKLLK